MPTIIFSPTAQLQQVDDFPKDCERTVTGAIHVRPGGTYVVSEGEAAHLKSKGIVYSVTGEGEDPLDTASTSPAPAPSSSSDSLPGFVVGPDEDAPHEGAQEDEEQ